MPLRWWVERSSPKPNSRRQGGRERNQYLLEVTLHYNKREASANLAFNATELRDKLLGEFEALGIYDLEGEDHSADALAVDKRLAIEERINAEEEEGEDEEEGGGDE